MSNICINSDFEDYYDELSDKNSIIKYNRFYKNCKSKGSALKALRKFGIKTIEVKQVSDFYRTDGRIVVYTDPMAHDGNGKKIMTVDEANLYYNNS